MKILKSTYLKIILNFMELNYKYKFQFKDTKMSTSAPLFQKAPFERLVRDIIQSLTLEAFAALQELAELYLISIDSDFNLNLTFNIGTNV